MKALLILATLFLNSFLLHDGPDPVLKWRFDQHALGSDGEPRKVKARLGPDGKLVGQGRFISDEQGGSLFLEGGRCGILVTDNHTKLNLEYPSDAITVSFWGTVDQRQPWGGLVGLFQDNGSNEFGWVLGYNNDSFTFGLASKDTKKMTYLAGETNYEPGKFYHVVAVYDGQVMQLYVNGKLDGKSEEQSGPILYPPSAPITVGAYHDADEFFGHRGRIREICVYSAAAKAKWVKQEFSHSAALASLPANPIYPKLDFEISPYLQFGTQTSMTVMWKTNRPASSVVRYGETSECEKSATIEGKSVVHEIELKNLKPETQYFYRVESSVEDSEEAIASETFTFQTAVRKETAFAFAVISDTQGNPEVSLKLAEFAWGQRPNFLIHPGDLVSTGSNDSHWTDHFFPGMKPLIERVPFYPVLGNHEQNAKNYFDYVSLPNPEYYYTFDYGNMQFFMIDSNRNVDPGSEQYKWLDTQLRKSNATWKIVCHHHPPFSSDENDYGNLWKTNKSTRGDQRVRQLVPLYEKHNVDVVWNGHIHSYERTWAHPKQQKQSKKELRST